MCFYLASRLLYHCFISCNQAIHEIFQNEIVQALFFFQMSSFTLMTQPQTKMACQKFSHSHFYVHHRSNRNVIQRAIKISDPIIGIVTRGVRVTKASVSAARLRYYDLSCAVEGGVAGITCMPPCLLYSD